MPDWLLGGLLALLALVPFGTFLTLRYQRRQATAEEKRRLRENGSAAVTPVNEFLARVGPGSIVWGADDELRVRLQDAQRKWWDEVRPPLLVYANAHPSRDIHELANEVTTAVQQDIGATRYLLEARRRATDMTEFNEAEAAHTPGCLPKPDPLRADLPVELRAKRRL